MQLTGQLHAVRECVGAVLAALQHRNSECVGAVLTARQCRKSEGVGAMLAAVELRWREGVGAVVAAMYCRVVTCCVRWSSRAPSPRVNPMKYLQRHPHVSIVRRSCVSKHYLAMHAMQQLIGQHFATFCTCRKRASVGKAKHGAPPGVLSLPTAVYIAANLWHEFPALHPW